ncbi:MAG TPA: hypothetical protein VF463_08590 [Sphingobium sp.]
MARPKTIRIDDWPIPEDAQADPKWPPIMLDMAAHIGPYATLLIVDAFAGQEVYVSKDPARSPFSDIIGADKAETMAHVYGVERLRIPGGRMPLLKARRAGILAACRAKKMSVDEGAAILRMPRRHLRHIVNHTQEALTATPMVLLPRARDARQLDMFDTPD